MSETITPAPLIDENFIKKLGGRKLTLVMLVFVASLALLITTKLNSEAFVETIKLIVASYLAGNIGQSMLTVSGSSATDKLEQNETLGRKFYLIVVLFTTTAVLRYFNLVNMENFISVTYWLVTLYTAGNVLDKVVSNGLKISLKTN